MIGPIAILIFAISCLYLFSSFFKKRQRGGEGGEVNKNAGKANKVQESARSYALRSRFSVPEAGKISISINRDSWLTDIGAFDSFHEFVLTLTEASKIYIMVKSASDEEEQEINNALLAKLPSFPAHRILHHQSQPGHIAFIRQLSPHLHIEQDADVYKATVD
eukprot:gene36785-44626_t